MQLAKDFSNCLLKQQKTENLDSKKCIAVCSDGANMAITGKNGGLIIKLKEIMPQLK